MRIALLAGLLLCAALAPAARAQGVEPEVTSKQLGPDTWQLDIRLARGPRDDDMEKVVKPRALALCNDTVRFKKASSYGTPANGGSTVYTQIIRCGGDADPGPPGSEVDGAWRPTAADDDLVSRQTRQMMLAFGNGRFEDVYDRVEPLANIDRADLGAYLDRFREASGPLIRVTILSVGWEANPPLRPYQGGYAIVRFRATFAQTPVVCGTMLWYRHGPGDYRMFQLHEVQLLFSHGAPPESDTHVCDDVEPR